tara:strand:+ start:146 stop:1144 length:999 start_codon:yes stop_codon:yes gene_type:complete
MGKDKKYTITHLGKTFNTIHYREISDEKCIELKEQFYEKPSFGLVEKQFKKLYNGGKMTNVITDYYIKGVMSKARLSTSKWSIKEFFECNDLIRFAYGKIKNCSNFYKDTDSDIKNIKTVLRLSPSGTAAKVSNFPYKTMLDIFNKYNVNNNYYDFSCGWGIRLLSSMANNINYFGTDPNVELVDILKEISTDFKKVVGNHSSVDIRSIGSQYNVKEWEDKIGLAFSSPPYFDLEHYNVGEQSIDGVNYNNWINGYWKGTVDNVEKYLIKGGYFLLNMKNIKSHNTLDDMCEVIEAKGFEFVENLELKNINRIFLKQNNRNTNEVIAVFKKK